MYYYTPKLFHAMLTAAICLALIALGAKTQQARVLFALNVGALLFALMTVVVLWMLVIKANDEHWDTLSEFAKAYNQLDAESRAALGFQFPEMRYKMKKGEVREMFENTNVPIELFRTFLKTSNGKYISPERDWASDEKPRWAWLEIKEWLEEENYIVPDSAAGSHSWLWRGQSWDHLKAYWSAGVHVADMNKRITQTRSAS